MTNIKLNKDYINWLNEVKTTIRTVQVKAALAANSELISFYWGLGRDIFEKQKKCPMGCKTNRTAFS